MIKSLADRLRRTIRLVQKGEWRVSSARYNHAFCFGNQLEPRNVGYGSRLSASFGTRRGSAAVGW
jgi:hypothetical protein